MSRRGLASSSYGNPLRCDLSENEIIPSSHARQLGNCPLLIGSHGYFPRISDDPCPIRPCLRPQNTKRGHTKHALCSTRVLGEPGKRVGRLPPLVGSACFTAREETSRGSHSNVMQVCIRHSTAIQSTEHRDEVILRVSTPLRREITTLRRVHLA